MCDASDDTKIQLQAVPDASAFGKGLLPKVVGLASTWGFDKQRGKAAMRHLLSKNLKEEDC